MKKKDIEKLRQADAMEPTYYYNDITIVEADGYYKNAVKIMRKCGAAEDWYLRSTMTMIHPVGMAEFDLQFTNERDVHILDCKLSSNDQWENADIRLLKVWCIDRGWKIPEPSENLISEMPEFWRHMYRTATINSPVIEDRYGKRRNIGAETDDE
jgi:hypothetical protein